MCAVSRLTSQSLYPKISAFLSQGIPMNASVDDLLARSIPLIALSLHWPPIIERICINSGQGSRVQGRGKLRRLNDRREGLVLTSIFHVKTKKGLQLKKILPKKSSCFSLTVELALTRTSERSFRSSLLFLKLVPSLLYNWRSSIYMKPPYSYISGDYSSITVHPLRKQHTIHTLHIFPYVKAFGQINLHKECVFVESQWQNCGMGFDSFLVGLQCVQCIQFTHHTNTHMHTQVHKQFCHCSGDFLLARPIVHVLIFYLFDICEWECISTEKEKLSEVDYKIISICMWLPYQLSTTTICVYPYTPKYAHSRSCMHSKSYLTDIRRVR